MGELGLVTSETCPKCGSTVDTTFADSTCSRCGGVVNTPAKSPLTSITIGGAILLAIVGGLIGRQLGYFGGVMENRRIAQEYTIRVRTPPNIELRAKPRVDASGNLAGYDLENGLSIATERCRKDGRCPDNEGRLWEIIKP